jgi:hypothetical protein
LHFKLKKYAAILAFGLFAQPHFAHARSTVDMSATVTLTLSPGKAGSAVMVCHGAPDTKIDQCQYVYEAPHDAGLEAIMAKLPTFMDQGSRANFPPSRPNQFAIYPFHFELKGEPLATISPTRPDFDAFPSLADVTKAFPKHARDLDDEGFAVLKCTVAENGSLQQCTAPAEFPLNSGFGASALLLSNQMILAAPRAQMWAGKQVEIYLTMQQR